MADPASDPALSSPTPATSPAADRPPRTPRSVWVFGSVVALFLLAIAAFFLAGGDHGGGGGGGHAAGDDNAGAVEAPTTGTYRLFLDFQVDGVRSTDSTPAATEPDGAGPDAPGADHESKTGGR